MEKTILKDTSKEPRFKMNWDNQDFIKMKKALIGHFRKNGIELERGAFIPSTFKSVDECLGLAYTSSSSFAMYSVCNVTAYLDYGHKFRYVCFGIDTHNNCYAILWDKEENEIIIPL
jgi:hypothetical protein